MIKEDLLQQFPVKRPKAVDGMGVTAEIWEEAHEYHRQQQRFHNLIHHGPGIVAGLEVVASDPPDTAVYISPGVAVDPLGRLIAVTQPMTYDIGDSQKGTIYLLLSYGESRPRAEGTQTGGPAYVQTEFGVETATTLPTAPVVELARIRRPEQKTKFTNAKDANRPGASELDWRYRRYVGPLADDAVGVGVVYAGGKPLAPHARGAVSLARAFTHITSRAVNVDEIGLGPGLEHYTVLCLVGQGAFKFTADEMNFLNFFLNNGGTLFIESCRHDAPGAPASDAGFNDLLGALGTKLDDVKPGHALLNEPYLFPALPAGFETEGTPTVRVGEGVIFSTGDYGCLLQGERRGRAATREEIRAAMEWGENVLAYAIGRKKAVKK